MRNMMLILGCAAMAVPVSVAFPTSEAGAQRYKYREWRDNRGRLRCRKADGTTGLVVGGVAGALLGRTIDTRGDRTVGTLGGAVAGGLLGREVDRGSSRRRCG
ncbi:uncharacterized protein YcfJ [Sphingomonas jinjuensis]|uniref:17 kDa surface antigen n=1 Tax=Sphingomonas jinjuensis TaxID=535907 RepID=A0A840FIK1_9SPHN|nr:glycine zipper 2TM domain-containing protein [Sphingomonas jinjuensis]MBB4153788.1 uncharacterized protein YcfJ [Sphingomonas jinjuensis]